jgi:predicted anti-sigma-YlaC factor YlaD
MEGELSTNVAGEMQAHLANCAGCRQALQRLRETAGRLRHARAAEDPSFVSQVLQRLPEISRRHPGRWLVGLALPAAATLVIFLIVPSHRRDGENSESGAFVARGGPKGGSVEPATHLGVEVFVHPQSHEKNRVAMRGGERIENGDGFSFVVSNRFGRDVYLCLFAIDSAQVVHWFYPSYADAATEPQAIRVPAAPAIMPLSQGVTPEGLAPGRLSVVALFLARSVGVAEVEKVVAEAALSTIAQRLPVLAQQTQIINVMK